MAELAAKTTESQGSESTAGVGDGLLAKVVASTAAACEAQTVARVRQKPSA